MYLSYILFINVKIQRAKTGVKLVWKLGSKTIKDYVT